MLVPLSEEMRLLHASDILEPLSEEELEQLAHNNPDLRLEKGEILFGPEEISERLFIVKEGRIRLYKTDHEGNEITISLMDRGKLFGEMALTAQQLRAVYAQATEPSLLISLRSNNVKRLVRSNPEVGLRLIERLSERVRLLENRLEDVSFKEMPGRLASVILQLLESEGVQTEEEGYRIPTRYSHEQLATMVGANRVSVTRAFGRLREAGIVEYRDSLIHIKDIEALGRWAEDERRAKRISEQISKSD